MKNEFYIPRTLHDGDHAYTEPELLASFEYIIMLAEPGAGKTDLLGSLSGQLQVERVTAARFRHLPPKNCDSLVLDAFDEVSRIDPTGILEILAKAQATGAKKIIVSSRSSEWDNTYTHNFEGFFGKYHKIVRLKAFDEDEQKQLLLSLREHGIGAVNWPGSELPQEITSRKVEFPITNYLNQHLVMLPVHQSLKDKDIGSIIDLLKIGSKLND